MKVRIEQRGGFAGKLAVGERDLNDLTPAQRAALDKLVRSSPPPSPPTHIHPLRYRITITDHSGTRTVDVPEDQMPDELTSIPEIEL